MTISFVSQSVGTTTVANLTTQVGDRLIAFAFRDGSTSLPTIPAGQNWKTKEQDADYGSTGANSCSCLIVEKVATGTSTTVGTFTGATGLIVLVYRGNRPVTCGNVRFSSATGASLTWLPLVNAEGAGPDPMTNNDGSSWVVGFAGHRSVNTSLETAPSGMTARATRVDSTCEVAAYDTNGPVTNWPSTSRSVGGTNSGSWTAVLELREAVAAIRPFFVKDSAGWFMPKVSINDAGVWKPAKPYIKDGSSWVQAAPKVQFPTSGLRYVFDAAIGITQSSGLVSSWAPSFDRDGDVPSLTASGSARPTLLATDANGLPSLSFNGSSNVMGPIMVPNSNLFPTTTYSVVYIDSSGPNNLAFIDGGSNQSAVWLFMLNENFYLSPFHGANDTELVLPLPLFMDRYCVLVCRAVASGQSTISFNRSGDCSGNNGNDAVDGLTLGAPIDKSAFAKCRFAMIAHYEDDHTDTEKRDIVQSLMDMYGSPP